MVAETPVPNPRRVAAGKANRCKRKGLTDEGRDRLRQAALQHQPWRFSTGPRTAEGKAKTTLNGKARQSGLFSARQARAELANVRSLIQEIRETYYVAHSAQG